MGPPRLPRWVWAREKAFSAGSTFRDGRGPCARSGALAVQWGFSNDPEVQADKRDVVVLYSEPLPAFTRKEILTHATVWMNLRTTCQVT